MRNLRDYGLFRQDPQFKEVKIQQSTIEDKLFCIWSGMSMQTSRMKWHDSVSSEEKWRWGNFLAFSTLHSQIYNPLTNLQSSHLIRPGYCCTEFILPQLPKLVPANGHVMVERDQNLILFSFSKDLSHSLLLQAKLGGWKTTCEDSCPQIRWTQFSSARSIPHLSDTCL